MPGEPKISEIAHSALEMEGTGGISRMKTTPAPVEKVGVSKTRGPVVARNGPLGVPCVPSELVANCCAWMASRNSRLW